MAGENANDLLIDNLCITSKLSRINQQTEFGNPLGAANSAEATMMAALG